MRILVTGGQGYVGSVICAVLTEAGHEAVPYDLRDGRDVRDPVALAKELRQGYSAVIHCAARTLVTGSLTDPGGYWEDNLGGTLALLAAMRTARVRTVILSSTAAVYGRHWHHDLTEDDAALPVTPYGASKLAAETLLAGYARMYGFAATSLRYFNAAGAHQVPDGRWLGERHDPETHLIPSVLAAAAAGRPVQVCGDDYPTPDGTCIRDYVHVTDLAGAHLRALEACQPGRHRAYNLGTRAGFTVREVIALCREVTGRDIGEQVAARRPGDPARLVASAARARAELGWKPERDLRAIITSAWAFTEQERAA